MDPLYDYVSEIANRMYPTWEFDDSCGEYFQTDSFRGWDFVHQLEDGRLKSPFTKEQYLENAPIIRSLRAMGIDTEKFWMAILFVYDVVQERTENVQQVPTSVFEEFRTFAKYLQENPEPKSVHGEGASTVRPLNPTLQNGCWASCLLTTWQNTMPSCQTPVLSDWTDFR